jgi:uncharacterized spore protein YtfJ
MMNNNIDLTAVAERNAENMPKMIARIFAATEPGAIFGPPIEMNGRIIITASEISSGGGFGSGLGFGVDTTKNNGVLTPSDTEQQVSPSTGGGSGMGGGGGSLGRPVAVISIGPEGVQVSPIIDVSKIAIAALGAWAAMLPMILKARQAQSN